MGNYQEAVRSLKEAIKLSPQFADAFYNLGAAYANLGNHSSAVEWLRKALELNRALASEAREDEDFKNLRSNPDFATMTR